MLDRYCSNDAASVSTKRMKKLTMHAAKSSARGSWGFPSQPHHVSRRPTAQHQVRSYLAQRTPYQQACRAAGAGMVRHVRCVHHTHLGEGFVPLGENILALQLFLFQQLCTEATQRKRERNVTGRTVSAHSRWISQPYACLCPYADQWIPRVAQAATLTKQLSAYVRVYGSRGIRLARHDVEPFSPRSGAANDGNFTKLGMSADANR